MPKNSSIRSSSFIPGSRPQQKRRIPVDMKGKVDRIKAEKGRGKIVKDAENIYALIDSLIVCKNAKATFYKELPDMAKLYSSVTGFDVTAEELEVAGERINNLAKLINVREGLTRNDDTLPWKVMNQPVTDDGPAKGAVVTQDELELMLDDYYQAADGQSKESQLKLNSKS